MFFSVLTPCVSVVVVFATPTCSHRFPCEQWHIFLIIYCYLPFIRTEDGAVVGSVSFSFLILNLSVNSIRETEMLPKACSDANGNITHTGTHRQVPVSVSGLFSGPR